MTLSLSLTKLDLRVLTSVSRTDVFVYGKEMNANFQSDFTKDGRLNPRKSLNEKKKD